MKHYYTFLYRRFLAPRAASEDAQRQEFIFTILLLGTLGIAIAAWATMILHAVQLGSSYDGLPPLSMVPVLGFLGGAYIANRRHFQQLYVYIFILVLLALAAYGLVIYSYALPESLMIYALVVVMAGLLISSRAALVFLLIDIGSLSVIAYLQNHGTLHPDVRDLFDPLNPSDILVFSFILGTIALVAWLSIGDIERSLRRARASEAALKVERANLASKVRERTRELERLQVEKTLQLHRFAEFGRQSSTLLHELANPLTSVSLDLEQLDHSEVVGQARQGVARMERYVEAARRQIRNQSEVGPFDSAEEIERVMLYMSPKAQRQGVAITRKLTAGLSLYGDSIRFDQIIANLLANAIDASEAEAIRPVVISSRRRGSKVIIKVGDNGVGITSENLAKVFEPFYTTKPIEQGTGIGLSIVQRAVTEHFKGTISVSSSSKQGTVFTVVLPRYDAAD